jgi:Fe2+ or Zn2+ uptake regulation protein
VTFRVLREAEHWRCTECGRSTCVKDDAVEAYNATVRGTDGWGTNETGPRYQEMNAAIRDCHRAQKSPTENPLTELARVALPHVAK